MSVFALAERLAPHVEREVNLVINGKQEAASLSGKLTKIQVGLQEAERRGVANKGVKDWLKELEDVAYEMDEFESANLQVEVQDTSLSLNWDKVQSLLSSLSSCSCLNQVLSRREITKKMKALSLIIDTILANKGKFIFTSGENDPALEFKQGESTSLVSKTYGLKNVTSSLIHKLDLEGQNSDNDKDTQIVSIVGIGGVGKSTLAREAYHHPKVVNAHFAPKGWVSASQAFDALAIAKAILISFGEELYGAYDLETLVQRTLQKTVDLERKIKEGK